MSPAATTFRRNLDRVLVYGGITIISLSILLPIIVSFSVAFRPPTEFFADSFYLLPKEPTLIAWERGWMKIHSGLKYSFLAATGTTILALLVVIPGAYTFGRTEFPGREYAFYFIVLTVMFPHILLIVPITDIWFKLGLYNTLPGLWLGYQAFVTPFSLWILRDYFQKLPESLEEAARVYGCTQFTAFLRVILPLSAPAIAATAFLAFLTAWNDFFFASMITSGTGPQTSIVQLYNAASGQGRFWAELMAMSFIVGIPPVVLYMIARRYMSEAFAQ